MSKVIKQIKYFQAIVRYQSFTKAAEECFISQSAISQQIQALERELGVTLMQRDKRKFILTPAGEYFYRKSLVLMNDFERICAETTRLANGLNMELVIGYLRHYRGNELRETIPEFNAKYPEIFIQLVNGTHEELYEYLRTGKIDVAVSDLRRKTSDQYTNYFLTRGYVYAELPVNNPLAQLESLNMDDLKNTPIILIAPKHQEYSEEIFYREYFGVKGDFLFAENLEEAHLMVVSNKGYFPIEFNNPPESNNLVKYVPIVNQNEQLHRKYYAFWRIENLKAYIKDFADILLRQFDGSCSH